MTATEKFSWTALCMYFRCLRLSDTPHRVDVCCRMYRGCMFFRMPRGQALHLSTSSDTRHWYARAELSLRVFIIRGSTACTRVIGILGTVDTSICASWICKLNSALWRTWILIQINFFAWLFACGTSMLHCHVCIRNY